MATQGLTTIRSSFGPEETMNRFEAEVRARGMIAFAHIDHAAGAAAAGLSLRPTELLIFGNARGGTPLTDRSRELLQNSFETSSRRPCTVPWHFPEGASGASSCDS
jgi:uncharacterized protein (DUF302 family)